ncbi:hypothetical protein ACFE04_030100 [Oxalis oulophora]
MYVVTNVLIITNSGRLRVRQKNRIAQRNAIEELRRSGALPAIELLTTPSNKKDGDQTIEKVNRSSKKSAVIDLEEDQPGPISDTPDSKANPTLRLSKLSKHKFASHLDFPVNPDTSIPSQDLLPVLGLYAPNANQPESSNRNLARSSSRQSKPGSGPDFPFSLASCVENSNSVEMEAKVPENVSDRLKWKEASREALHHRLKAGISDGWLPTSVFPPVFSHGKGSERQDTPPVPTFAEFQEKMLLPKLPFGEKMFPRFPHPAKGIPAPHDLFPGLSLASRLEPGSEDHPTIPSMPNSCNNPERDPLPTLGLNQVPSFPPCPENHRKVLENIMMRTAASGSNTYYKRKSKFDGWSADELNSLWVGVRNYGITNWDALLRDPNLKFSKYKTPEQLAARWEEEFSKIFAWHLAQNQSKQATNPAKPSAFPSISDGMMARALHGGSRFVTPPKFQSHLTDMKLGFGDLGHLASTMPPFDPPDQLRWQNEHFPQIPNWYQRPNVAPEYPAAGLTDGPSPSNFPPEKPFLLNSFGASNLGPLGVEFSRSFDLQRREDEKISQKYGKLPSFLDRPLHIFGDSRNSSSGLPAFFNKGPKFSRSKGKEVEGSDNKLPHWLREAVSAPPSKHQEPNLPPNVSAIAQSVRVLYGDEKQTIPPFVIPGPPPSQPKDPRQSLKKKKKRKSHVLKQATQDIAGSSRQNHPPRLFGDGYISSSLPLLIKSLDDFPLPSVNLNTRFSRQPRQTSSGLSPSPEVLQLVASCVAPGPSTDTALPDKLLLPNFTDEGGSRVSEEIKAERSSSPVVQHCPIPEDRNSSPQAETGNSNKTTQLEDQSQPQDVEEISSDSEGTASDHPDPPPVSDHSKTEC